MKTLVLLATAVCLVSPRATSAAPAPGETTVAAYLNAQPKPVFREGHTLPPLTRYAWSLGFDTRVALARDWGYALEYGGYATIGSVARDLADPKSDNARVVELAAREPKKFPLAVICARDLPYQTAAPEAFTRSAEGNFLNGKSQSPDGTVWNESTLVWSPAAPEAVWREAGRLRAEPLRTLRAKAPIAIVLNGGEYGINVTGFAKQPWSQDPRVLKDRGDRPWNDYVSARKGRAEEIIAEVVRAAVPDRQLYVFYTAGGGIRRDPTGPGFDWGYAFEWMQKVSDLPSNEAYYKHFNDGWTGKKDVLSEVLSAKAHEIELGRPLSYNWLCAGWPRGETGDQGLSEIPRYMGFLKCYYTAGMMGGNAGYYGFPKGGFDAKFLADQPPHWLQQMMALGQVHALFSHLEPFLREGDLLPGPEKRHGGDVPSYEFPTRDKDVRVLARKRRGKQEWLLAVWAAAGPDREVAVSIPVLGVVSLQARSSGAVYRARLAGETATLDLLDQNGLWPSSQLPTL